MTLYLLTDCFSGTDFKASERTKISASDSGVYNQVSVAAGIEML